MWRRWIALVGLVALAGGAGAQKKRAQVEDPGNDRVGVMTRVFHPAAARNWRGAQAKELRVMIWYPAVATAHETPQMIGPPGDEYFYAGSAMPNAEFEPKLGRMPLVVMSHGMGASAEQMAWLGVALARAGFVAVAVNHPGNNSHEPYTPEGFALWWERATDLSNVIDALLADADLGPKIDASAIAAAGFSIGGYTVLELAGARSDISVFYDHCRKDPVWGSCHIDEMKGFETVDKMFPAVRKSSGESLARSGDSFRDARVKAVFAIAPGLGEVLTPESLHAVKVPVEMVVGDGDTVAPAKESADVIRANMRGARENVLPGGVGHYTFLDTCTAAGKKVMGINCVDAPGVDRDKVHAEVADEAVKFFSRALKLK